ncbi:AraC family transcriptional regulator [Verrucomicrobia bacterium S94]|nr:AraC family transcriptional regulator [Verrucomicrobia bacterium S94]
MNNDPFQLREAFLAELQTGQLAQLFNLLSDVYFVVKDRNGKTMMANELAVHLCGLSSEEEMIGKTDDDLFSPDRAEAYTKDDRQVLETGKPVIDRVELAPDPQNSINWFLTTKIPLFSTSGEVIGIACIARNSSNSYNKLHPYIEMNDVLEFIREHYAEAITIEMLARRLHLSSSQFERRFKKIFKITPARHIKNVRLKAACHLLSTTRDTIASIAQESGFYDHSHFARAFKSEFGISPGDYRKRKTQGLR